MRSCLTCAVCGRSCCSPTARPSRAMLMCWYSSWDERTRLLQSHGKAVGGFSAFEETFGVLVQRMLADRNRLLKRTQLRSVNRGNLDPPIGGKAYVYKQEVICACCASCMNCFILMLFYGIGCAGKTWNLTYIYSVCNIPMLSLKCPLPAGMVDAL